MEGTVQAAASRLAEYARARPEAVICQVEGTWHAWLPLWEGSASGDEFWGRDEAELLAKLPS